MATSKEFLTYVLDQLSEVDGISHRAMMGEYILYKNGKIAAYLCDGQMLVKPVPAAKALLPDAPLQPPYEGAKEMLLVRSLEDRDLLKRLLDEMEPQLALPKPRKKKG